MTLALSSIGDFKMGCWFSSKTKRVEPDFDEEESIFSFEDGRDIDDALVIMGRAVSRASDSRVSGYDYGVVPEGAGDADTCLASLALPCTAENPRRFLARRVSPALGALGVDEGLPSAPGEILCAEYQLLQTPRRVSPPTKFCSPEAMPETAAQNCRVYHPIKQLKQKRAQGVDAGVAGDVAAEGKNDVLFDTIREEENCGDSPHQEDGQGKEDERVGEKKSTVVVATDTASELTEVMEVVGVDLRSVDSLDEELNGVNPAVEVEGVKEEEEEWKNSVLLLSHAKQLRMFAWRFWTGRLPEGQATYFHKTTDVHGHATRSAEETRGEGRHSQNHSAEVTATTTCPCPVTEEKATQEIDGLTKLGVGDVTEIRDGSRGGEDGGANDGYEESASGRHVLGDGDRQDAGAGARQTSGKDAGAGGDGILSENGVGKSLPNLLDPRRRNLEDVRDLSEWLVEDLIEKAVMFL